MSTPLERLRLILKLTLLVMVSALSGCSGCKDSDDEKLTREELAKKRERERDALVKSDLISLPADKDRKLITVKPGHWHETVQSFKSNREDLQVSVASSVRYGTEPANLPATNFVNEYGRRTNFPKGQEKSVGMQIYIPPASRKRAEPMVDPGSALTSPYALRVGTELLAVPLMNPIPNSQSLVTANELKPNTYQLMAMSSKFLDYQFLSNLDFVRWAKSENDFEQDLVLSYDVALIGPNNNHYAIPSGFLTLTSVACIFWDDVSTDDLSLDQQRAILDWVHWGGQLIISGPNSWSRLQGSFLSDYLPSNSAATTELQQSDFEELATTWNAKMVGSKSPEIPLELGQRSSGLRFELSEKGSWIRGTGELVAESRVGRGRIVVTGFSLREPAIVRWSNYSNFISTGLLRRLPREIKTVQADLAQRRQVWMPPFTGMEFNAQLHSNLRILSRDLLNTNKPREEERETQTSSPDEMKNKALAAKDQSPEQANYEPARWSGCGEWNDVSGVATEAIMSLRAAAGIELPQRSTILKLLGGYLVCLVPLNWLFFKLIGRLEYAWIAAPIMALAGVFIVGKVARLDIGFARRTTEIGVLEMHGGYGRAHLTQYIALYTSLSTNYSIEFPETDSVALPMGDIQREMRRAQMSIREMKTTYGRSEGVLLEPLTVYSNSTEMLHSEQMLNLNSPVQLVTADSGVQFVQNSSSFAINAAVLVRRPENGGPDQFAWIDHLDKGERKAIQWDDSSALVLDNWAAQIHTQKTQPSPEVLSQLESIWIGGLLHQIGLHTPLSAGQTRLVGYTNESLGALKVTPSQDQYDNTCVVVAHLAPASLGRITPDRTISGREMTTLLPTENQPPTTENPE